MEDLDNFLSEAQNYKNNNISIKIIQYIVSINLFKNTYRLLNFKFFREFKLKKVYKNNYLIRIDEPNSNIIITKEGKFETGFKLSINEIGNLIIFLYDKIKNNKLYKKEKIKESLSNFSDLKIELENFYKKYNFLQNIPKLFNLINEKLDCLLFIHEKNESYGYENISFLNYKNLFYLKCISEKGEILTLKKNIYNNFYTNDYCVRTNENELNVNLYLKIMKRLIEIRKIKLQLLYERNPFLNYLININDENSNNIQENFDSEYYKKKEDEKIINKRKLHSSFTFNKTNHILNKYLNDKNSSKNNVINLKQQINYNNNFNKNNRIKFWKSFVLNSKIKKLDEKSNEKETKSKEKIIRNLKNKKIQENYIKRLEKAYNGKNIKKRNVLFIDKNKKERNFSFIYLNSKIKNSKNFFSSNNINKFSNSFNLNNNILMNKGINTIDTYKNKNSFNNNSKIISKSYSNDQLLKNKFCNNFKEKIKNEIPDYLFNKNNNKSEIKININSYKIFKKENYIESRNENIIRTTRNFYIRFKNKIKLVKK